MNGSFFDGMPAEDARLILRQLPGCDHEDHSREEAEAVIRQGAVIREAEELHKQY